MWSLTKKRGEIQVWPLKTTDVGLVLEHEKKKSIQPVTINQQIHFYGGVKQPIIVHILLIGGIQKISDPLPQSAFVCFFLLLLIV
jgi:hypothetical protein